MTALSLLAGAAAAAVIGLVAYWRHSLDAGGVVGATVVGALVFGLAGPVWAAPLVTFFVTSSFLTHFRQRDKEEAAGRYEKAGPRDAGQVLANGGLPALLAVLYGLSPHRGVFAAYLGMVAAATADTWATEVWVNNDVVNLVAILGGGLAALLVAGR